MTAPIPGQMAPDAVLLNGFIEVYDFARYPDAENALHLLHNHVLQNGDLPAAIQVFAEDQQTFRAMKLYLEDYFIAPMKYLQLHPWYMFQVVTRLVKLEPTTPVAYRVRFWLARRCLQLAERLMTPSGSVDT